MLHLRSYTTISMIRKHLNLCSLAVLLISFSCVSGEIPEVRKAPSGKALKHYSILDLLRSLNFPNSDCLQIVTEDGATIDSTNQIDNSISYMFRDLSNMANHNIYDYEIQDASGFAERRPIMNYYQCSLILVYPKSQSSLDRLLGRSNRTMFYPHTKLVVIGLGDPEWNHPIAKYIREKALYLLFLDDTNNHLYSMSRHGIVLENRFVAKRFDPSVGQLFEDDEKDVLRVSSFEYVPYVIYLTDTTYVFYFLPDV